MIVRCMEFVNTLKLLKSITGLMVKPRGKITLDGQGDTQAQPGQI